MTALVSQGVMTWESPAQSAKIERVATLPEMHFAITVDMEATIKMWNCRDRDALATNAMSASCGSLEAVLTKDGPFVSVSDPPPKSRVAYRTKHWAV